MIGGTGPDVFNGGAGEDTVSYAGLTRGVSVSLDGTADDGALGEGDNVEDVIGGSGNDTLTGNDQDDAFYGGAGNDTISGGDGNERGALSAEDSGAAASADARSAPAICGRVIADRLDPTGSEHDVADQDDPADSEDYGSARVTRYSGARAEPQHGQQRREEQRDEAHESGEAPQPCKDRARFH